MVYLFGTKIKSQAHRSSVNKLPVKLLNRYFLMAQVTPVKYSSTEIQYELEGTTPSLHESFCVHGIPVFLLQNGGLCTSLSTYLPVYLLLLHLHNAIIVNRYRYLIIILRLPIFIRLNNTIWPKALTYLVYSQ